MRLLAAVVGAGALLVCGSADAEATVLAVANEDTVAVVCSVEPGAAHDQHHEFRVEPGAAATLRVRTPAMLTCAGGDGEERRAAIEVAGYGVARVRRDGIAAGDANDFQVALSGAARACDRRYLRDARFEQCVLEEAFGGLDADLARDAWRRLWQSEAYWRLCEPSPASPSLRSFRSAAVPNLKIDVLREEPFVAAARGFLSGAECRAVSAATPAVRDLARAHVGSGKGKTTYSDARETLSTNLNVDWDAGDAPLTRMSAKTVELASELLGERIPYEGQEPVNYLHYLVGYEYKPHSDGGGGAPGKRVATSLAYCETASSGGATVFTEDKLKFVPRNGDLLFFEYKNGRARTTHAACPVLAGNKTTLTHWHRLGVTPETPWDNFEDWGEFGHPHIDSRYTRLPFRLIAAALDDASPASSEL